MASQQLRGRDAAYVLLVFAPLAVSLSFILSTGPLVQTYLVALLNTDAPTIYASAYNDSLARFPRLAAWIAMGFHWLFLSMGSVVAFFALRELKPRRMLAAGLLSTLAVLTTVDIAWGLWLQKLSVQFLFENIAANFFGAATLSLIVIAILLGREVCCEYALGGRRVRNSLAGIFVVAAGVFCSTLTYYVVKLFYQPLPVRVDVLIAHPIASFIVAEAINKKKSSTKEDEGEDESDDGEVRPFKLIDGKYALPIETQIS